MVHMEMLVFFIAKGQAQFQIGPAAISGNWIINITQSTVFELEL